MMVSVAPQATAGWQPLHVDGRHILGESRLSIRGLDYRFVRERVTTPTRWRFNEPHHTFVVHHAGRLRTMRFEYEDGPRGTLTLQPGDVWVIPAGHRCGAVLVGDSIEYVQLTVSERVLGHGQLRPGLGFNDPLVHESVKRLSSLVARDDVTGLLMRESIGEAVRLHLRDQYTLDRPEAAGSPRRLTARSRRLIAEHLKDELASDISLERLAELAKMPVSAFVTAFTATFGDTPYQYVLNRRIDEAQRLLASTEMPIRAVGEGVGFSTPSHFASTFRHRVGVTPSQYRSNARN